MVFPKRIYYGFKDFQPSSLPKGSRSSRGRRAAPGNIDRGNDMFAFNLLATVAGNLLNDKETQDQPSNLTAKEMKSIVKHELQNDNELPKFEPCDQGSCDEGKPNCETLCKPFISQGFVMKDCSEASSSVVVPPVVAKLEANEKSSYESTVDTGKIDKQASLSAEREKDGDAGSGNRFRSDEIITNLLCAEDIQDLDLKPPPNLVSSDSSVELPPYQKQNYTSFDTSIPNRRVGVKFSNRYNDQNSSRCYPSDIINSNGFKSQCIGGDRKIKKSSEAVFRKVKTSRQNETKCMFRSGQMYYAGQKIQKSSFKRRKFFERFTSASHQGEMKSDMFSMSPEKSLKGETSSSATALNAQTLKLKPDEHNVKCSIKSFMVPEVIINMPDSATIGELKRRTEDALTNLLHYGLQVGIALQGKKISDDSKTLHQIGITDTAKFGSLGFSLEVNSDYQHCPQPSDASEPVSWFPVSVPSDICMKGTQEDFTCQPDAARIIKKPKTGFDLFPLAKTEMQDTSKEDVNALAVVPVLNSDPLSVIPLRKSKRSELVQRRIRRPFSVSEVEALVHAVEKLGTGRWRDVKIRAFDNAKHRTYVDLKDKWKTLVHTARISPQQRRGEPVPQELLDRVLSAHAYWSQQQARSQIKHEPEQHILA